MNGDELEAIFETSRMLSETECEKIKDEFRPKHLGSKNAHRPIILEEGMRFTEIEGDHEQKPESIRELLDAPMKKWRED